MAKDYTNLVNEIIDNIGGFYFRPTFVCYLAENVDLSISFACFFVQLLFFEVEGECKMVLINRQVAWSGRTQ